MEYHNSVLGCQNFIQSPEIRGFLLLFIVGMIYERMFEFTTSSYSSNKPVSLCVECLFCKKMCQKSMQKDYVYLKFIAKPTHFHNTGTANDNVSKIKWQFDILHSDTP